MFPSAHCLCFVSFQGYSYVAPSVLFSENVVSDDIFHHTKRPSPTSMTLPCIKVCLNEIIVMRCTSALKWKLTLYYLLFRTHPSSSNMKLMSGKAFLEMELTLFAANADTERQGRNLLLKLLAERLTALGKLICYVPVKDIPT